jgi:hypothetical protein
MIGRILSTPKRNEFGKIRCKERCNLPYTPSLSTTEISALSKRLRLLFQAILVGKSYSELPEQEVKENSLRDLLKEFNFFPDDSFSGSYL